METNSAPFSLAADVHTTQDHFLTLVLSLSTNYRADRSGQDISLSLMLPPTVSRFSCYINRQRFYPYQ